MAVLAGFLNRRQSAGVVNRQSCRLLLPDRPERMDPRQRGQRGNPGEQE